MKTPFKHQKKPIELLKENNKYGLFLEMGLGKTYITLHAWHKFYNNDILVVLPKSVMSSWESEAKEFTNIEVIKLDKGSKKNKELLNKESEARKMFLISYQSLWRLGDEPFNIEGDNLVIVFDESHKVKGDVIKKQSKQADYALKLSKHFITIWLLTGTPISVGYQDLWNQMNILGIEHPSIKTKKSFKEDYLNIETQTSWRNSGGYVTITGYKNIDKLLNLLKTKSIFMTTNDSGIILPEQLWNEYYLEKEYEVKEAIKNKVFKSWKQHNTGSALMAHRTMASGFVYGEDKYGNRVVDEFKTNPKRAALAELLEQSKDNFAIFYNFENELKDIKQVAKELDRKISVVNGKEKEIGENILAVQYQAGAEGLNLQDYNRMIFYSPTLQGSLYIQASKRIHRIGQEKTCFYYKLISKDSIEERIYETIEKGKDYTERMFGIEYEETKN